MFPAGDPNRLIIDAGPFFGHFAAPSMFTLYMRPDGPALQPEDIPGYHFVRTGLPQYDSIMAAQAVYFLALA
jgi:hypothetical protein